MTTQERIRRLFLFPKVVYPIAEAAELLEYSENEIVAAIDSGEIEITTAEGLPRVAWSELTVAAAERWPQQLIEDSLDQELHIVIPELARLADLQVRVPRYGVV